MMFSTSKKSTPSLASLHSSFLTTQKIAHRGLHGSFTIQHKTVFLPENSLAAFQNAVQYHFAIELDIHFLSDHTVVVLHDNNTRRLTQIPKKVKTSTLLELTTLRLQPSKTTESHLIPTLNQVLELVAGRTPLLIELKSETKVNYRQFCQETLNLLKIYQETYPQGTHPR